jgi:hypothetical protein
MKQRGSLRKLGWVWSRKGWKKVPRRMRQVKAVPLPSKRKTRKIRRISPPAPRPEAPEIAQEQGRAVSAPIPTPKAAQPTARPLRRAWSGKYNDLSKPTEGDA